ncbi:MAG: hypothetical protein OEY38_20555 [Gammaproteobacteria bacterium]|nr:hypothetical protein [Gammaproteobacteria bacterium]
MRSIAAICFTIATTLFLTGCGDPYREELESRIKSADQRLSQLKTSLDNGSLQNALILKEYGRQVSKSRPEMDKIVDALVKDGTAEGQLYQHLEKRLNDVKTNHKQYGDPQKLIPEAEAIMQASSERVFNKALSDPINVLADLSNGVLPRVGVMSKNEEATFNDVKDFGDAAQLVGNPAYGQWTNRGGSSVWEFVGAYFLLNSIMGRNPVRYDSWNRHRPYSRHQDDNELGAYSGAGYSRSGSANPHGRSTYSKSASTSSKSYSGARKSSTFSKGSGVSYRGNSGSTRTSGYSSKSSSYSGSLRSGSSYSRGTFGGK